MKGVIYARYSSHNQTERSIEGQFEDCMTYAKANKIDIINTYADRAMSGTNDNRDSFQQMLKDSSKGLFDAVIVWKVDRFGRNREEIAINKVKLKKNGVKMFYAKENIPDGPEGIILESVLEGMAEYFSANLAQNVKRGMHTNALSCKANGGSVPFGYSVINQKYVVDENKAPIVKELFTLYDRGYTFKELNDLLNSRGLKTARGNQFTNNSMRPLLSNEKYIGIYKFDDVRVEGGIPAIVDTDLFYRVQRRLELSRQRQGVRRKKLVYALSGKIFCAKCGQPYIADAGTSQNGVVHNYYTCKGRKNKKGCQNKNYRKDELEKFVIEQTRRVIFDADTIELIANNAMEIQRKKSQSIFKAELLRKKVETEKSINNLLSAIEQGIFTPSTKQRLNDLEDQKSKLESAIIQEDMKCIPITREAIVWFLKKYQNEESGKSIIRFFVNSVLIDDDTITIIYNYTDKNEKTPLESVNAFLECSDNHDMVIPIELEPTTSTFEKVIIYMSLFFYFSTF